MKKYTKRVLSLMLVLMLLFSTVQMSAVALFDFGKTKDFTVNVTSEEFDVEDYNESAILLYDVNGYNDSYGAQLDDFSKKIYDDIVEAYVTDKKSGPITVSFSEPVEFITTLINDELDDNDPEYVAVKEFLNAAHLRALYALLYDYPQQFWFKSAWQNYSIQFSYVSKNVYKGTISAMIFGPVEITTGASSKIAAFDNAVNNAKNIIEAKFGANATRQEKLKIIHDYICNETNYGQPNNPAAHTAGAFFLNECDVVCEGYAKAFKILCDRFGIPCACISGYAGEAHMWNYVQMDDGKWYLVDVTWDDQDNRIYDTYFLAHKSKKVFNGKVLSEERTEEPLIDYFKYPVLSATAYKPHSHSYSAVVTSPSCTNQGYTTYVCTCGDYYLGNYVSAKGHTIIKVAAKAPTCTSGGYKAYEYCNACAYTTYTTVPAKGHSYTSSVTKAATHLSDGVMTYRCTCGDSYTNSIPKINEHSYVVSQVVDAGCTVGGYSVYVCACGSTYNGNYTNDLGHVFKDGICRRCNYNAVKDCGHMCHKNGIIWRFICFFLKLFGIKQQCKCGMAHY